MMADQSRSKRPKRCSARRNPEAFLYALSWQEERDIQRAMYKSLKERRLDPSTTHSPVEPPPQVPQPKSEPTRKSPRIRPALPSGFVDGNISMSQSSNECSNHDNADKKDSQNSNSTFEGMRTRQQDKPNRPLLMRASSSSTLEENGSVHMKVESIASPAEPNRAPTMVKKRILAPRRSMGEIPVELWVDPTGKPVVTRDFLDFLCYRGSPGLPPKLAWFELAPHKRPQAQLFTTGHRGASVTRPKVTARDKRTSVSGGLISDSSSNSGGSTGLSRRNSGQSSPSGEDNAAANSDRRSSARDVSRPRKKSRSLFYQIMTAKLRRLQNNTSGKRSGIRSPAPSPPPPPPPASAAAIQPSATNSVAATVTARSSATSAATRAALRRSRRVQQQQQQEQQRKQQLRRRRQRPLSLNPSDSAPEPRPNGTGHRQSHAPPINGTRGSLAARREKRTVLTRQRSKDILLRAKSLRRR